MLDQTVKGRSYWLQSYGWNNLISEDSAKKDVISWPNASMCATLPDLRFETQHFLTILADYDIQHSNAGVRRISSIGQIHKESNCGYMFRQALELSPPKWNHNEAVQATQKLFHLYKGVDYLKKYHITWYQNCVLCTETEHFPDSTSEICTVQRNWTHSRWYTRNM